MESMKPPLESGGVSSTLSPVNSESKYLVSVSLTTWGLKGGVILFFSRSDQLMLLKKGWDLTALKGWLVRLLLPVKLFQSLRRVFGASTKSPERILDEKSTQEILCL